MDRRITRVAISIALMSVWLASAAAWAQVTPGQKVETKGLILTRDGDTMTVDTKDLGKVVVALNDETKAEVPKGVFRHSQMEMTSLIPGLQVDIKGTGGDNGQIVAERIRFTRQSLQTAQQMHAAMTATNAQVATNQQGIAQNQQGIAKNQQGVANNAADIQAAEKRFDNLTEFDTKKELTLNFPTGQSTISEEGKKQLTDLATQAKPMKGYLIQVKGFASTTGDAKRNQELSDERADAVVAYLQQQGITPRHIVNPAAMGTASPVASNETEEGQLKNQRVEVKLLVNRGLAGK